MSQSSDTAAAYRSPLSVRETEVAIKLIKDCFETRLAERLQLIRVSAPLFVTESSGINDNLNGVERPVSFDALGLSDRLEVVQSLAKWKRLALQRYGFAAGEGLYTDMNAIRRDEQLDHLHSYYVDQWDWERVIQPSERCLDYLQQVARLIYRALRETEALVAGRFASLPPRLPTELQFLTSQELEDRFPDLSPKAREDAITRELGAVFLMQIGGELRSGLRHDGRAPDYDDWQLNGDLLLWHPQLQQTCELSSMGIRVDGQSLRHQLALAGCEDRLPLPYHQALLRGELPLTIGGGIGQSRICLLLLQKAHIGEVQAAVWPEEMRQQCAAAGIALL